MTTFRDLKAYLDHDPAWTEVPNRARGGGRGGDHLRYRKTLSDGRVLRTKVSRSLGDEIGESLLHHIVRYQLETTMAAFREGASGPLQLPSSNTPPDAQPIPGWLVVRLIHPVGLDESIVRAMSAEEAAAAWESYTRKEAR